MTPGTTHVVVLSRAHGALEVVTLCLEGHSSVRVAPCASRAEVVALLEDRMLDLLIVDLKSPPEEVGTVLREIRERDPGVILLFLGEPSGELRSLFPGAPAVPEPVSVGRLRGPLEALLAHASAAVEDSPFSLTDYLQLAALGQHSVRFEVILEDGTSGMVDLVGGVIRHSECDDGVGLDALRSLLARPARSLQVRSLGHLDRGTELELPVPRALLDLAVERDSEASPGAGDGEGSGTVGAGPAEDGFDSLFVAGIEASLEGDYERSVELFRGALELRPGEPRALHNLKRAELLAGDGSAPEEGDDEGP